MLYECVCVCACVCFFYMFMLLFIDFFFGNNYSKNKGDLIISWSIISQLVKIKFWNYIKYYFHIDTFYSRLWCTFDVFQSGFLLKYLYVEFNIVWRLKSGPFNSFVLMNTVFLHFNNILNTLSRTVILFLYPQTEIVLHFWWPS